VTQIWCSKTSSIWRCLRITYFNPHCEIGQMVEYLK
jgi:hypothetical protein